MKQLKLKKHADGSTSIHGPAHVLNELDTSDPPTDFSELMDRAKELVQMLDAEEATVEVSIHE